MSNMSKCIAIILCMAAVACTRRRHPQQPSAAEPPPTPKASATVESKSSGGSAGPELGDTAPENFAGTVNVSEKRRDEQEPVVLSNIRVGTHEHFDRVVFEFVGKQMPGFKIEYVDKPVTTCGAGEAVAVSGQSVMVVQIRPAQAHDDEGNVTIGTRDMQPGLPVLKQTKLICDFEADVEWALGLSKRQPYRVLELNKPSRLVIDIKH